MFENEKVNKISHQVIDDNFNRTVTIEMQKRHEIETVSKIFKNLALISLINRPSVERGIKMAS
jgi:hypothetical protein